MAVLEVIKHIPGAALSDRRASAQMCSFLSESEVWSVSDVQDKMKC